PAHAAPSPRRQRVFCHTSTHPADLCRPAKTSLSQDLAIWIERRFEVTYCLVLKKAWTDPVWSAVIAGAILAVLGAALTYFAGWWPAISGFFAGLAPLAAGSTTVPNWLLALLVLCAFVVGGVL